MAYSKYKNVKTLINGHEFGSKAEAKRYVELHVLSNAGVISQLKLQAKYELIAKQRRSDGTMERACHYLADFYLHLTGSNKHGKKLIDVN